MQSTCKSRVHANPVCSFVLWPKLIDQQASSHALSLYLQMAQQLDAEEMQHDAPTDGVEPCPDVDTSGNTPQLLLICKLLSSSLLMTDLCWTT